MIWTALADVRSLPQHDVLEGFAGAYVRLVAQADSRATFAQDCRSRLRGLGLELIELDEVEDLDPEDPPAQLREFVDAANTDEDGLIFGTWHRYPASDGEIPKSSTPELG